MVTPFPREGQAPKGGVEAAAAVLCEAIAADDTVDLHVLVLGRGSDSERTWFSGRISVHLVPYRQRGAALFGFSGAVEIVREEARRLAPSLVHAQGLGAEGVAVSRLDGVPTCVTPHGDVGRDVTGNVSGLLAHLTSARRRSLAKSALRRFDAAIAIAAFRPMPEARRVAFVPNPIDPRFIARPRENGRNGLAVVASIKRIKRIEHILLAANALALEPALEISIAGGVENEEYFRELEALSSQCSHVRVQWLGLQNVPELADLYSRSAALVVASEWEISPMCVAEAMACGCPVIVPDLPGTLEMVGGGERGAVFQANDLDQLGACVAQAIRGSAETQERAERALSWAQQRFAPASVAGATVEIYSELTQ